MVKIEESIHLTDRKNEEEKAKASPKDITIDINPNNNFYTVETLLNKSKNFAINDKINILNNKQDISDLPKPRNGNSIDNSFEIEGSNSVNHHYDIDPANSSSINNPYGEVHSFNNPQIDNSELNKSVIEKDCDNNLPMILENELNNNHYESNDNYKETISKDLKKDELEPVKLNEKQVNFIIFFIIFEN